MYPRFTTTDLICVSMRENSASCHLQGNILANEVVRTQDSRRLEPSRASRSCLLTVFRMSLRVPTTVCTRCLDKLGARARSLGRAKRCMTTAALPTLPASKFQTFFFHHPSSPRSAAPQSTSVPVPEGETRRGVDVHRGADMSRFPVLLPLPSEEELATFKPVPPLTAPRTLNMYLELAKGRLTVLNVLGAMTGVALCPLPTTVPVLLATAAGTALCSAAANAINEISEVPYDAQMARTRMRPLVRRHIKPLHAAAFATTTGIAGPLILWNFASPMAGAIGAGTMLLYAFVYTPMKRRTVLNTWVGSVVGAAPPVLGWAAVGGVIVPSAVHPTLLYAPPVSWEWVQQSMLWLEATVPYVHAASAWPFVSGNPLGAAALFAFMFSWQFPHFNPLAHFTREGYAIAGYRMLSVTNPAMNARVSLRHAVALAVMSSTVIPLSGLTTWAFAATSVVPNAIFLHGATQFWRSRTDKNARWLFHLSLAYLPVMFGLMMYHKEGTEWLQSFKSMWQEDEDKTKTQKPNVS